MSKLENCFLRDFMYPCATYVVQRLGLERDPITLFEMEATPYDKNTMMLYTGDILIWDQQKDVPPNSVVLRMSDKGPITSKQIRGRHMAVYEGNGIISELIFYDDAITPSIRQMYLYDKKYDPVEIIRYSSLIED